MFSTFFPLGLHCVPISWCLIDFPQVFPLWHEHEVNDVGALSFWVRFKCPAAKSHHYSQTWTVNSMFFLRNGKERLLCVFNALKVVTWCDTWIQIALNLRGDEKVLHWKEYVRLLCKCSMYFISCLYFEQDVLIQKCKTRSVTWVHKR